jgi:protein TonB
MSAPPDRLPRLSYDRQARLSPHALLTVVLLHAAVLAVLVSADVVPLPEPLATLMVQVIREDTPRLPETPEVIPPRPHPQSARPRPQPVPPMQPAQILAAESPAPAPAPAPEVPHVAEPQPLPPIQAPEPAPAPPPPVTAPRFDADYLDNPKPVYPPISRRLGEEGRVVLRVFVEPSGRPSRVEFWTRSGSERLDQAARSAVEQWKFVPARQGETAVGAWVLVPIVFSLKE